MSVFTLHEFFARPRRRVGRALIALATAATAGFASLAAEPAAGVHNPRYLGTPFTRAWKAEDYDASPVNWQVAQHPRTGFIYVANNHGLLEFDGARWRLLELPGGGPARSIAFDGVGNGWVGGLAEIAFFPHQPNGLGSPQAITARLPEANRSFGNVTRALATPDGVYFATGRTLLHFPPQGGAAASWTLPQTITGLWRQSGELRFALANGSLHGRQDAQLVELTPGKAPRTFSVLAQREEPDGTMLLLTSLGTRRWRGPGQPLTPEGSPREEQDFAGEDPVAAAFLADGRRTYGFLRAGLRVFDRAGQLLSTIDDSSGVPGVRIEDLFPDTEGGLWVADRTGLSRLQMDSRYALHGSNQGLGGSPRVVVRQFNRLYVAHNEGVDWRDDATGRFHTINGLRAGISTFARVEGRLFGVGPALYEILPDHRWTNALPGSQLAVFPVSHRPGVFVAGNTTGVSILRFADGQWRNLGRLAAVTEGVTRFRDGGDGTIWGVAYNGGSVWRLDFRAHEGTDAPARRFTPAEGLPPSSRRDSPRVARLGEEIFVTSATGTRRFDSASGAFLPGLGIENFPATLGAAALTGEGDSAWWLTAAPEGRLGRFVRGDRLPWRFEPSESGALRGLAPNSLFHDAATRTLWIATQGPLVSADLEWQPSAPRPALRAFIREVMAASGGGPLDLARPLPPENRSLRIHFAAPSYEGDANGRSRTLYRTFLEGLDEQWTEWQEAPLRDFTNLPYSRLTLRVQARAIDGRESEHTVLAFTIRPPWWRSDAMLIVYGLTTLAAIAGIFRWRTLALRRSNLRLEKLVATRTAELERLRQIDRDESAAARLAEEKARLETLRYQLNPHFLYNALNSIRALTFKQPHAAGEMIQQLADLCRITLTRDEEAAPLAEEFAMLRLYLEMEKTRWRDLLEFTIECSPAAGRAALPPFLLLPLVENALKHGRAASAGPLLLRLTAELPVPGTLVLTVANSGTWLAPGTSPSPSTGIGLENLRQRLARCFPGRHSFTVESTDGWVHATLRLTLPDA